MGRREGEPEGGGEEGGDSGVAVIHSVQNSSKQRERDFWDLKFGPERKEIYGRMDVRTDTRKLFSLFMRSYVFLMYCTCLA